MPRSSQSTRYCPDGIRLLLLLTSVWLLTLRGYAELPMAEHLGNDPMTLHTPKKMGLINNPRCWAVTQGETGFIYAATSHGLDVYDGVKWTLFPLPGNTWPTDLAELGTYKLAVLTASGLFVFDEITQTFDPKFDLSGIIKSQQLKLDHFFLVRTTTGALYLTQRTFLAKLNLENGELRVIPVDRSECILGYLNGDPVMIPTEGCRTNLNALNPGKHRIVYLEPEENPDVFFAINQQGLFGELRKKTNSDELDFVNQGSFGTSDFNLSLFSKTGNHTYVGLDYVKGLVELSRTEGVIRRIESSTSSLPSNEGFGVCIDAQGGLWVGTSKGLLRIQNTPLKFLDSNTLGDRYITDVLNLPSQLLLASTSGMFRLIWNPTSYLTEVTRVYPQDSTVWNVESFEGFIHSAGYEGIRSVPSDSQGQSIETPVPVKELEYCPQTKRFFAISPDSFQILRLENNTWERISRVPLATYFYKSDLDVLGNLWLTSGQGDFYMFKRSDLDRIESGEQIQPSPVTGVEAHVTNTLCLGEAGTVITAAANQVFHIDPDTLQAKPLAILAFHGLANSASILKLTHIGADRFIAAVSEQGNYHQLAFDLNHPEQVFDLPGIAYLDGFMYSVSESDTLGNEWFFGPNGAVKANRNALLHYTPPAPVAVSIRNVRLGNQTFTPSPVDRITRLGAFPSTTKGITLEVSLPFFARNYDPDTSIRYEFVVNNDKDSTIENHTGVFESALLKAGRYRISIVAVDTFNRRSEATNLEFLILPPWYLSLFAKIFYGILVLVLFYLISQWRLRVQEDRLWQDRLEMERRLEMEAATKDAQLQALRLQINPHFLFNSLTFISNSLREHPSVKESVDRLAGFLKHALDERNAQMISLTDELKAIEQYLQIEKAKSDRKIEVQYCIKPETTKLLLPGLIVQPIVENALKYGEPDQQGVMQIAVKAEQLHHMLKISVQNSGVWKDSTTGRTPIGMKNVEKRLKLQFGDQARMEMLENRELRQVEVQLWIPLNL